MESRYKLTMCRLCLGENECFLNIFTLNDWQGYVPAEVISDLLQFQVSETDAYPHVVCSTCLTRLTEFRLFKEYCQKSKDTYDDMFVSLESPEEHKPEMNEEIESQTSKCSSAIVDPTPSNDEIISSDLISSGITVKVETLEVEEFEFQESNRLSKSVIGISTNSIEISDDFESEITIKEEPLQDVVDGVSGLELCEENPLREALSDVESVNVKTEPMYHSDIDVKISKVQLTAVDLVTPYYPKCLENNRPNHTSKGAVDADLCIRNITTNDESIFENSKNISLNVNIEALSSRKVERLEGQWISPGERMNMAPFNQEDIVVSLEVDRVKKERDMVGEGEEWKRTSPEKGFEGEVKRLECFHCGSMLMTKRSLIKHMKLHRFGQTYDCNICGKAFKRKFDLKGHAFIHTASKPYKCEECGKLYSYNSSLKRHVRLHSESKKYKCCECMECFSKKRNLKVHMKLHTGSKPYKCVDCSKCFSYNSLLIVHMRKHTGSKPYACTECSKKFRYVGSLKQHMIIHTRPKPYKCADCSKGFTQNSDLTEHMRSHMGYKPYKCAECSKCFRRNSDLIVHMRMHTGSKPFKCGTCSKGFTNSSDLKKHSRVHTNEKPFECNACRVRFRHRRSLKMHLERRCNVGTE